MEKLNLNKKVYSKNSYEKVINTSFSQLISTPSLAQTLSSPNTISPGPTITVDQFFNNYNDIFFNIPKTGENSHESIIKQSSEYIGYSPTTDNIQALIEEINSLQRQNLDLTKQIISLQTSGSMTETNL